MQVLGVAETHWTGSGHFTTETGEMVVYSGGTIHRVIFALKVASSVLGYRLVNDRVMWVRINTSPFNLSWIQVYASTTDADEEELEALYGALQHALDSCSRQDIVIVAGDFNAKVGANSPDSTVCGRFGVGTPNEAGERLVDFCQDNDLYITNTALQ